MKKIVSKFNIFNIADKSINKADKYTKFVGYIKNNKICKMLVFSTLLVVGLCSAFFIYEKYHRENDLQIIEKDSLDVATDVENSENDSIKGGKNDNVKDNINGSVNDNLTNNINDNEIVLSSNNSQITFNPNISGIGGGNIEGNCKNGKKNLPIYYVDADKNQVSLSFDAAWGADDTIKILDILDKYQVKVTFFMTGGWVDSYPDMVKEIYNRGHDLGNHSQNHKQMSKLDSESQKSEIKSVCDKVRELTGYNVFLFRPPYGDYDNKLIENLYGMNIYPIQWNVDSLDWKDYGRDSIVKTVLNHKALCNGSIVLMHNGSKYTPDALEEVITGLQKKGYEIVPISQLIIKDKFHMSPDGKQVRD